MTLPTSAMETVPHASIVPARDFTVYPAIDVRDGRVVRLAQGDYARETRYGEDPFAVARAYAGSGARWLHLVDLDAARAGGYTLQALVGRIAGETGLKVQTGGGIRSDADVEALLDAGATRVVIGTLAVTHRSKVVEWLARFGPEQICIAIDVRRDARVRWCAVTHGWTVSDATDALALIEDLAASGLRHLLSTDVERDGMLSGPALDWYVELSARVPGVAVQGSGGVTELTDISALRSAGCGGAIIGRALLENRFELRDALVC